METVQVEYIGSKDTKTDNVAGTDTIWYGNGDVQPVDAQAWPKLAAHSSVWRMAEPSLLVALPVTLLGSDKFPSMIELGPDKQATLGDVVRGAFDESGLEIAAWNALSGEDRDNLIGAHIAEVRDAFAEATPKTEAATPKPVGKPKRG